MLASDGDRDRVLQYLREAYVQGRLLHQELDERISATLRARSIEELQALIEDLRPKPAPPVPTPVPAGLQTARPNELAVFYHWWPALLIGIGVLAIVGSDGHLAPFLWWMFFPAFFWLKGGRRRYRYRGPRF